MSDTPSAHISSSGGEPILEPTTVPFLSDSTGPYVDMQTLPPGASGTRLGDYELLGELGKGGMGVVFRARQCRAERIVALKLIRRDRVEDLSEEQRERWLERFRTEAQAAARLEHDHIVTVYEVGEAEGCLFYSMKYVPGCSLADLLARGLIPNARAAAFLEPVARAVHFAHEHGILHRDLKPRNILVDADNRPYVSDFGLAKILAATEMTHAGECLGTPSFMAPEQSRDAARVTTASDVYSLGATLYALLTGRPPFQAATVADTLHQLRFDEPVPPRRLNSAIDRDLETICLKCLHKEADRRYETAAELAEELARYRRGEPIRARPLSRTGRALRWMKRRPAEAAVAALGMIATFALVGLAVFGFINSQVKGERDYARYQEGIAQEERDTARKEKAEADRQRTRAEQAEERRISLVSVPLAHRLWRKTTWSRRRWFSTLARQAGGRGNGAT